MAPNGPLNFDMSLYIPIWSEEPYDVSFSLSENGYYQLKKNVLISSVTLIFDITPTPEITLDATGTKIFNFAEFKFQEISHFQKIQHL